MSPVSTDKPPTAAPPYLPYKVIRCGWFAFEGIGRPYEGWAARGPLGSLGSVQGWATAGRAFTHRAALRKAHLLRRRLNSAESDRILHEAVQREYRACAAIDCGEPATFTIIDQADPNPYTCETLACEEHVGELLGHDLSVPEDLEHHAWTVRVIE